jgi:hypothetical protein
MVSKCISLISPRSPTTSSSHCHSSASKNDEEYSGAYCSGWPNGHTIILNNLTHNNDNSDNNRM